MLEKSANAGGDQKFVADQGIVVEDFVFEQKLENTQYTGYENENI